MSRGEKISRSKVRELHGEGMTDPRIARKLKAHPRTIWRIRNRELGLKPNRGLKLNRSWGHRDYDALWDDYWSGMTLDELVEKYGYSSIESVKRAIGGIYLKRGQE